MTKGTVKKELKKFGRYVWELFKASLPIAFMFFCAGTILMMLTMKGEKLQWNGSTLTWTLVCGIGGVAYDALVSWANGGSHYEMLVSGNVKRISAEQMGEGYRISSHKEAKEYRVWKGFAIGAFAAIWSLIFGLVFGCNQAEINSGDMRKGLAVLVLLGFLLSGWSILPFYYLNAVGKTVNYFWTLPFALIPIVITGAFYIIGAYSRRNKRLREQAIAARAAEAEANREKKINYGALPGTKPKKRKK